MPDRFTIKKNGAKWSLYDDGLKAGDFRTMKGAQQFASDVVGLANREIVRHARDLSLALSDSALLDSEAGRILDVALTSFIAFASE